MNFDILVIGAGPGGYVCAIRAAQLGLKVGIVEKEHFGGICANWGCIPTKALLRSSEVYHLAKHAKDFGVIAENIKPDLSAMIARSRNVAKTMQNGVSSLMKKNKIETINGTANFVDKNTIEVQNDGKSFRFTAKNIVIATGARARILPGFEPDGERIWTYKEAMNPSFTPKSVVVIGSGAIGAEFAYFYNSIGVKTTILEAMDRILPVEDKDVSSFVEKSFKKDGMDVQCGVKLQSMRRDKKSVEVFYELSGQKMSIVADALIMAVGVVPNTENLNLDLANVKLDGKNLVSVDSFCQTSTSNIYAIGDIVTGPWLAHKASHEGVIVAEKVASELGKYDKKKIHPIVRENIPGCTYCKPQVASLGLTEEKAKEKFKDIKVGKFPLMANGKAVALGEIDGFVKIIFAGNTGEIIGCHMVGAEVTEMIQGIGVAKQAELTEEDLMQTIFPHPTISESIHEAALSAYGKALHF